MSDRGRCLLGTPEDPDVQVRQRRGHHEALLGRPRPPPPPPLQLDHPGRGVCLSCSRMLLLRIE